MVGTSAIAPIPVDTDIQVSATNIKKSQATLHLVHKIKLTPKTSCGEKREKTRSN